ncbi:unnamed protein product [Paramecium sonneborni]|uniref:NACHT domain-containing protein n=1 Tax=Paramecium sonneborni TaxID=65129 RepID=A0A8S1LZ25_9CILI|nr:unnamed protein product [Paramecium sonneborni]
MLKQYAQRLLLLQAVQWFIFQEETIYNLIKNVQSVERAYDLILEGIKQLLISCLIFIKTDPFKCLYILQITSSLSKVIFSFHILNEQRFMKFVTQHEFLEICDDMKQQIEIEKNDLIQNQLEHYLFLTKASFEMAPNNNNEKKEILKGCLKGIIHSIITTSIDSNLLQSLLQGASLFIKMYNLNQKRKQYEVYYQLDMLQWELINYFRSNKEQNLVVIISQLEAMYEKLVKGSNNWNDHYSWIQMIGNFLVYNPQINKKSLDNLSKKFQYHEGELVNSIWKELQRKRILMKTNFGHDQAIILLNQIQNEKSIETDKLILREYFLGWENFLLFKEYLMGTQLFSQQLNTSITFESYLKSKLNIGNKTIENNQDLLITNTIQNFLSLIISNQLLNFITQNYERLSIVQQNLKNFIHNNISNLTITQKTFKQQIQAIISNLQECLQNFIKIIKIYSLNLNKTNNKNQHSYDKRMIEIISFYQLIYLIRFSESILKEQIQEIQQRNDERTGQKQQSAQNDINLKLINEIILKEIKQESNLSEKNQQMVNKVYQKFLDLTNTFQNLEKFKKDALSLLNLLESSQKQIKKSDIFSFQNQDLIIYFKYMQENLFYYFEEKNKIMKQGFEQCILILKKIMTIKYEIEIICSTEEEKSNFEGQFFSKDFENIEILRFEMQKQKLQLIIFQEQFQDFLTQAQSQQELEDMKECINLDNFLLDIVKYYPKQVNTTHCQIYKEIANELNNKNIEEIILQRKLAKLKGLVEFSMFKLNIEEQMIESERLDQELIEKEFGELFLAEQSCIEIIEKIKIIIQEQKFMKLEQKTIQEKFNQQKLKLQQEKYENWLKDLKQISDFRKVQNQDRIGISYLQKLINQIEKIIQAFNNSLNQYIDNEDIKSIFLLTISDEQVQLMNILNEYYEYLNQSQGNLLKQQNENDQKDEKKNQQEQLLMEKKETTQFEGLNQEYQKKLEHELSYQVSNDQNEVIDVRNSEGFGIISQIFINVLKLLQIKIKEEKQFLFQLLQVIQSFIDQNSVIENQKKETKEKIKQHLNSYFQTLITNFEEQQWTTADLKQNQNENLKNYFERLSIILQQEQQKNEEGIQKKDFNKININDFLHKLKICLRENLIKKSCQSQVIQIEQDILIQQISKIYFNHNQEYEAKDQLGLLDSLKQKYKDFKNNDEWKIKQGLVFTIIQVSSNSFNDEIFTYCQKSLIKLWAQEKDQRIRNLLKNQNLLKMQMLILNKDWKTQNDRIANEMQQMLRKIDDLQDYISHEVNPNKRDQKLQELDDTTEQLNEYIQNINQLGKQLNLATEFVIHIQKGLSRVEEKIKQMKEQLNKENQQNNYQKLENGKYQKRLQQKMSNQFIFHQKLTRMDQIQQIQINMMIEKHDKTVLLIHGVAGSGKSTTAKKIEEFIWKLHNQNIKIRNKVLVPIYISLPSLKNPIYQAVEEALHQDEYGFDSLQLKECKEMLEKKEFRLLFIMDSYDEMKLENIQKNLYISNKLYQNWSNPLVIFTTRSEIFISIHNYIDWFSSENKQKLKEITLQKFDEIQQKEYLKKFTLLSIKLLIFEIYEWQSHNQGQMSIDIQKFELFWEKLQFQLLKQNLSLKSESLLNQKQIDIILELLQNDQLFTFIKIEAIRSLNINLQKLWSVYNYENMMKMVNLDKLVETPYMMEIIVQVLPLMIVKATEIINLRQTFINNCSLMLKELLNSKSLIKIYQQQQNKLLKQSDILQKTQFNNQINQLNLKDIEMLLDQIDYKQEATFIWDKIEQNQIPKDFQISSNINDIYIKLLKAFETDDYNNKVIQPESFLYKAIKSLEIQNEELFQILCYALKKQNLTGYDFYNEFITEYYFKQIEKQRNLGKSINTDRFLHDLKQYSIKFAKVMSAKELTQVIFKQQGLIYKDENKDEEWLDEFFNDDRENGSYKKDIRSCSLIQQKGTSFQFVHKSIQEFLIAADLYEIFEKLRNIDVRIFSSILEKYQFKNKNFTLELNVKEMTDQHYLKIYSMQNLIFYQKQLKLNAIEENVKKTISILQIFQRHEFNKIDFSIKAYEESRKFLMQKISTDENIIQFLKFIVHLTALEESLIQSGSNSLNLLVEMKIDLTQQSFRNIRIKNTSLNGASFAKCDLSGSQFQNFKIHGINLNGAILINCKWKNLYINELHKIEGHIGNVDSVCISTDGLILASGSSDTSIRLWDIKSGEEKYLLQGHNDYVRSVNFSPDGKLLASGSDDKSIRLWDTDTGQEIQILQRHSGAVVSVCFSPDLVQLASGSWDKTICLWNINSGETLKILEGHSGGVMSVCYSPDGQTLASGSRDESIFLWDLKLGNKNQLQKANCGGFMTLSFSPDGTLLISGSCDKCIRIWDIKSGIEKKKLEGHGAGISSICFSPDGTQFASGSWDKSIRIWDLKSGEQTRILQGHSGGISSVCFSSNGVVLASGSWDKSIRLWDVKSGEEKKKQQGHHGRISQVSFSPDGIILASVSDDETIRLWDVNTGKEKKILIGHKGQVSSVCFISDGTTLATGGQDTFIRIWDVKSGEQKKMFQGHRDCVRTLCYSPDGSKLASGSEDTCIYIWDLKQERNNKMLQGHSDYVTQVIFFADGKKLASCSEDESIRLWDVDLGKQTKIIQGHYGTFYSLCLSSVGTIFASGNYDRAIHLWDFNSGDEVKILKGHCGQVLSVCFSPDGTKLASGSMDNTIRLWDVISGKEKFILQGHNDYVLCVCFSPDGSILASSSVDKSIRFWKLNLFQEMEILQGQTGYILPVQFTKDDLLYISISNCQVNSILIQKNQKENTNQLQEFNHNEFIDYFYNSSQETRQAINSNTVTVVRISQNELFSAEKTFILNGEFTNQLGMDLRKLFHQKGSIIMKTQVKQVDNEVYK